MKLLLEPGAENTEPSHRVSLPLRVIYIGECTGIQEEIAARKITTSYVYIVWITYFLTVCLLHPTFVGMLLTLNPRRAYPRT